MTFPHVASAFLPFEAGDIWVRLAKEVFDAVGIARHETRTGMNMSPFLRLYCRGYAPDGEVVLIPAFANGVQPGLVILLESLHRDAVDHRLSSLERRFGARLRGEEWDTDGPDDAAGALAPFHDPAIVLEDGRFVRGLDPDRFY